MALLPLGLSSLEVEPLEIEADVPDFGHNSSLYNITTMQGGVDVALMTTFWPVAEAPPPPRSVCCCCCCCAL